MKHPTLHQEVAFLPQRIETFDGVAILASNQRDDLDEAFTRRFEAIVNFPIPRPGERLPLWRKAFPPKAELAAAVDLTAIASEHTLSGGSIMNLVRSASQFEVDRRDVRARASIEARNSARTLSGNAVP